MGRSKSTTSRVELFHSRISHKIWISRGHAVYLIMQRTDVPSCRASGNRSGGPVMRVSERERDGGVEFGWGVLG